MENRIYGPGMVFDIKPVADILPRTVDRQWLPVADIVYEQRDQLFGELIRAVIVRTVRDDGRMPNVSWNARTKWSLEALLAE